MRLDPFLTDRRCRFNIDNDGVVVIDQVIDAVGVKGGTAMRPRPSRRRIGLGDELGRLFAGAAECGVIKRGEIFIDCAACFVRRQTLRSRRAFAAVGVRLDQAGVDGEAFAAHKPLRHATAQHLIEQTPEQIAFAEPAMAILLKGRMIRHIAFEAQPTKPAIGQIDVNLLTELAL